MTDIKIFSVEKNEYSELTGIWERAVRATHDFLPETDILFFRPLILNEFLPQVRLFCTKNAQGNISGFIGVSDNKIEMLFIDPEYFGQGLGKTLLLYAVEKLNIYQVDVNEQNQQAADFYFKNGFKIKGRSETDGKALSFAASGIKVISVVNGCLLLFYLLLNNQKLTK